MKILFAYDGSESADVAMHDLQWAGFPREVEVVVLSVDEQWLPVPASFGMVETGLPSIYSISSETEALAKHASAWMQARFPAWNVRRETTAGSPARILIEYADKWQPDLIVVGSHGRSALGRLLLGSVSQKVLTEAHCSVRVARGCSKKEGAPSRIMIGIDGSKESEAAVRAVASRTWPPGSSVRLITAIDRTMETVMDWVSKTSGGGGIWVAETLEAAANKLRSAGLDTSPLIERSDPRHLLCKEAERWGADSIFVGARGLGAVERFRLGSVSAAVAARAACSVEAVRGR